MLSTSLEVFGRCQEEIIDEWRLQAGELLRERNLDHPTLTDQILVRVL